MSAYPNSDLNPLLAAGSSKVSVISKSTLNRLLEDSLRSWVLFPPDDRMDVCEPTRRTPHGSPEPGFLCEFWENCPEA